jgi:RNA polymerase sigma-70 factor (ECF subfamily)
METFLEVAMVARAAASVDKEASFNALITSERRRLYGIAYSILRDHGHAEDALQETMLKAWRSWDKVQREEARAAWLSRVTVTQCINRRKFLRRRAADPLLSDNDPAPADPRLSGRMLDLDKSYLKLSVKQRAAIFLHYHFGYSIDECAELMSCSSGSVRTHLHRAIKSMRKGMSHV